MKVEVEISDDDAIFLEKIAKVDPTKFIQSAIKATIEKMKEAVQAVKQGLSVTPERMIQAGMEVSERIAEEAGTEEKQVD